MDEQYRLAELIVGLLRQPDPDSIAARFRAAVIEEWKRGR